MSSNQEIVNSNQIEADASNDYLLDSLLAKNKNHHSS
jgi:hypothetical protein